MTRDSNEPEEFGAELRKRASPEFARQQRRRAFWAGLGGIAMGLAMLAFGVDAMRTGVWVKMGRVGSEIDLPGWIVVLMALFLLFCGVAVLRRFARKP